MDEAPLRERSIRESQRFLQALPLALPKLVQELSDTVVAVDAVPPPILSHLARNSSLITSRLFECVRISAHVSYESEPRLNEPHDVEAANGFDSAIAADYLTTAIQLAFQLSELAAPGCVWAAEGATTVDGQVMTQVEEKHFISEFRDGESSLRSWPAVSDIPLLEVVDWAVACGMLNSAFAETRVQRTLAAFTHVVGQSMRREGETLFRAMQGLEAFYCDGTGDLRRQLAEKVRLWLGAGPDRANVVGHLYDLRSQYVHGSGKLQYWHPFRKAEADDPRSVERLSDGVGFAVRLLVASLQRCVASDATDVQWVFASTTTAWKSQEGHEG